VRIGEKFISSIVNKNKTPDISSINTIKDEVIISKSLCQTEPWEYRVSPEKQYKSSGERGYKPDRGKYNLFTGSTFAILEEDKKLPGKEKIENLCSRIKSIDRKNKKELLSFTEELMKANKLSHDPVLLEESQKFISSLRPVFDHLIPENKVFPEKDSSFLEYGKGDPVLFFTERFPSLQDSFNKIFPDEMGYREYIHGQRELTTGNQIRDSLRTLDRELEMENLPREPGIRIKAVLRMVMSLFYSGIIPAIEIDKGNKEIKKIFKEDGFNLSNISSEFLDSKREISNIILENTMKKLNFTHGEISLAIKLMEEVPLTGNNSTIFDALVNEKSYMDYKGMDGEISEKVEKKAKELGITPQLLMKTGYIFHAAFKRMEPYELRDMKFTDGTWQPSLDFEKVGMKKFNSLKNSQTEPEHEEDKMFKTFIDESNELDKIAGEIKDREIETKKSQLRPVFIKGKLNSDGIMLVHATKGFPKDGILYPNSHYENGHPLERNPRGIVEFSWNGVIDQWNNAPAIILTPLNKAPKENIFNLWYTATSHMGPYNIPEGSVILIREGTAVSEKERQKLREKGIEIKTFPANETSEDAVEHAMTEKGYSPLLMGTDICGGIGTETTWFDEDSGIDYFTSDYKDEMIKKSEELAKEVGIPSAKGTDSYPLGYITLSMEGYKKDLESGHIKKSYEKPEEFKKKIDEFSRNLNLAEQSLSEIQKNSDSWKNISSYARAYLEIMSLDYELCKNCDDRFYESMEQELKDRQAGLSDRDNNNSFVIYYVKFINWKYNTSFNPQDIKGQEDQKKLLQKLMDKYFSSLNSNSHDV
jgi:hypothetical protein